MLRTEAINKVTVKLFLKAALAFCFVFIISCKKLAEVDTPSTYLSSDNVYADDATATAVLTGIYTKISMIYPSAASAISSISLISGLSADELSLYGGAANLNISLVGYYFNKLSAGSIANNTSIWNDCYSKLYIINLAIEKLKSSSNLTPSVRQQLIGECQFLRAFFYFYLVNLYGDIPLTTSSDYRINSKLTRTDISIVYSQIIKDLKDAQNLLSEKYLAGDLKGITADKVRPNKWAAKALLARVYLYVKDWTDAEAESNDVIGNALYHLETPNSVFIKNSAEAIWQLQPVNSGWNTEDARIFILPSTGPTSNSSFDGYPVYLTNQLLNSFEANDNRKTNWTGSVTVGSGASSATYYYPYKYKSATLNAPVTEYTMVLRLGEQYLIRAEARAHLNKITEGLKDLNVIRHRAGLPDASATDQNTLLNLIYHERQVELFTEWGHRWLDLKRTGKIDEVMSSYAPVKGTTWSPNWALYPIPLYDITQNPNLKQNPGY